MENLLPYLTNKKTVRKILNSIRKGSEGVSRSLFSVQREEIIGWESSPVQIRVRNSHQSRAAEQQAAKGS